MKRLLTILLPLLLVFSCSNGTNSNGADEGGEVNRNDWERENLYGEVKILTESSYQAEEKSGEIVIGELEKKITYQFDSKGNKIERLIYNADQELLSKAQYQFDSQGNMIEEAVYSVDGELYLKTKIAYDSQSNAIEEAWYDGDGVSTGKFKHQYDSQGNAVETAWYDEGGELVQNQKYQVDSKGNKTEQASYDADGQLQSNYKCQYDSQGNMIEKIGYDADGEPNGRLYKHQYEFDETGNWIKEISHSKYFIDGDLKLEDITTREIEYY